MNKETVCAVVVTYNRKELLIECIEALINQTRLLDAIYIIDNASTDGTPELLKEKGFIQELPPEELNEPWEKEFKKDNLSIYYVRMNENTGGAGGFYEGIKRAYEKGYDWLWLMDDDVKPQKDTLNNMFCTLKNESNVIGIVPRRQYKDDTLILGHEQVLNTMFIPFTIFKKTKEKYIEKMTLEGPLIKSEYAFESLSNLLDYFILYDDVDIAYKLSRYGKLVYDENSKMIKQIKILDNLYSDGNEWKQYYRYRNLLLFIKNNLSKKYFIASICIYSKEFIKLLVKGDYKYLNVLVKSLWHFLTNKKGKVFTPENNPWRKK